MKIKTYQELPRKPTLNHIYDVFRQEKQANQFLYKYKIFNAPKCTSCSNSPQCSVQLPTQFDRSKFACDLPYVYRCPNTHRHVYKLTHGSILAGNTKVTPFEFIKMVYLYSTKAVSPTIQNLTGLSDKTVNHYLGKVIRPAVAEFVQEWYKSVQWKNDEATQIDEMKTRRKTKHNQGANKPAKTGGWGIVMCNKDEAVVKLVDYRTKDTVETVVLQFNGEGQPINVDGFKSYKDLFKYGYPVCTTEHKYSYVNYRNRKAHTNKVEGLNGCIRRWLSRYLGFKTDKALNDALQEWAFFYNFKNHPKGLFLLVMDALAWKYGKEAH